MHRWRALGHQNTGWMKCVSCGLERRTVDSQGRFLVQVKEGDSWRTVGADVGLLRPCRSPKQPSVARVAKQPRRAEAL